MLHPVGRTPAPFGLPLRGLIQAGSFLVDGGVKDSAKRSVIERDIPSTTHEREGLIVGAAVAVTLLITLFASWAYGFTLNRVSLFALIFSIGILVDDAIVVVENVERVMHEDGLSPREATRKSMAQITSALVGIVLVLSAVFIPMAFFGGSTGVIYRQFSVAIVSAMALSVLVALTLTPALCATLLRAGDDEHNDKKGFFSPKTGIIK